MSWLRRGCNEADAEKIVWVAELGQTPGWDIEDRRLPKKLKAYEVKGTNASKFPSIEITANELSAAEALRHDYNLVLVTRCESVKPVIAIINDPWKRIEEGYLVAEPTVFRLERVDR